MNSLITYLKNSRAELMKVSWPSRALTTKYTIEVLIVSAFIALFLFLVDMIFNRVIDLAL